MTGVETVDFHSWKTGLVALFVSTRPYPLLIAFACLYLLATIPLVFLCELSALCGSTSWLLLFLVAIY